MARIIILIDSDDIRRWYVDGILLNIGDGTMPYEEPEDDLSTTDN